MVKAEDVRMSQFHVVRLYISQKSFLSMGWLGQQHCKTLEQSGPVCAAVLLYIVYVQERKKGKVLSKDVLFRSVNHN